MVIGAVVEMSFMVTFCDGQNDTASHSESLDRIWKLLSCPE